MGLDALRAGRLVAAEAAFREALRIEPAMAGARYNRACALSRLGRFDEAAAELIGTLAMDLPRFRAVGDRDADLAALRGSRAWPRVVTALARVEREYERALSEGAPMVWWRRTNARHDLTIRAGVWVDRLGRFVPLTPAAAQHLWHTSGATRIDVPGRRAILAFASGSQGSDSPCESHFHAFRIPDGATLFAVHPTSDNPKRVDLVLTRRGVRYRVYSIDDRGGPNWSRWREVTPDGESIAADQSPVDRADFHADPDEVWAPDPPVPRGFRVRRWRLVTPSRSIPIPRGPGRTPPGTGYHEGLLDDWVIVTGSTAIVAVATAFFPEGSMDVADEATDPEVRVFRVDLEAGTVEHLAVARQTALARVGPDGALYLQLDRRVRRYTSVASPAFEELPPGLALVPPD